VALILYNFLTKLKDAEFEEDDDGDDDMPDQVPIDLPANEATAVDTIRAQVQRHLLTWHFNNNPNLNTNLAA